MSEQRDSRELDSRASPGSSARNARGRAAAPRLIAWIPAPWLPIASKLGGGCLAAVVLAIVGWGARGRAGGTDSEMSSLQSSLLGPSNPAVLVMGMPTVPDSGAAAPSSSVAALTPASSATADHPPAPSTSASAPASADAVLADGRIVLNLASEDDLRHIPGIGPTRARAIITLRQRLAKFRAVEDLLRVKGIGRKMIQRIKPAVVVDRPVS